MLFAAAAGCGGDFQLGEVSGVVSLDGEPLSGASLYFQPQRQGEGLMVGPPSIGVTDERGHYTLKTSEGSYGAVVGPHKVSISTFESRMVDPKNSDRVETVSKERVPARYRAPSELTFTVSPSGSSEADFDLTTR
ncbi:hypothetical protein Pla111_14710 [Botrimarina hoheduenensis]|uniref:Carboxypeptidase regulatory-like domain-containing protein n=2 Tax=Botrimarina hoheduenensis TaxID=2528000 RepID=A0A5C5WAC2_9BACT|nr:hypothetical protein Pla111_14710 [Botrimarina hoheduenensis]